MGKVVQRVDDWLSWVDFDLTLVVARVTLLNPSISLENLHRLLRLLALANKLNKYGVK